MIEIAVDADEVLQELQSKHKNDNSINLQTQIESQEHELQRVKQTLADLYPDYKSGILNTDQYLMNKEKYERQQQLLETTIGNLKASAGDPDVPPQTNDFVEHFKNHGNISALTRPLLAELIERITVGKDGSLAITFNFTDAFSEARQLTENKYPA